LYLVGGRRIDRAGATDRLRPWSKKTARSCKVLAPLSREYDAPVTWERNHVKVQDSYLPYF
jgi:hypothetical protein